MSILIFNNEKEINSVFQLLGTQENDITKAIVWVLKTCPSVLESLIKELCGMKVDCNKITIEYQKFEMVHDTHTYTDMEIYDDSNFHIILEAKRGWNLPKTSQLEIYSKKESFFQSTNTFKKIFSISECTDDYADRYLPLHKTKNGIEIGHISWKKFREICMSARNISSNKEKYEEYFTDDIVSRFVEFVKTVYGEETLEENLQFIADALGNKGNTSREVIRNYFLKDFYADHLKVYQKRPIYWLFDSGKQNGFKALIYMHRYDADTVGRVRTDYLHKAQKYVETAMQSAQYTIDNSTSASEKSKATKAVTKYAKQLAEMKIYDEAIAHVANQRIEIDLDDGVKVNYAKFQGVEVAQEGKKALKVNLLAKI